MVGTAKIENFWAKYFLHFLQLKNTNFVIKWNPNFFDDPKYQNVTFRKKILNHKIFESPFYNILNTYLNWTFSSNFFLLLL